MNSPLKYDLAVLLSSKKSLLQYQCYSSSYCQLNALSKILYLLEILAALKWKFSPHDQTIFFFDSEAVSQITIMAEERSAVPQTENSDEVSIAGASQVEEPASKTVPQVVERDTTEEEVAKKRKQRTWLVK